MRTIDFVALVVFAIIITICTTGSFAFKACSVVVKIKIKKEQTVRAIPIRAVAVINIGTVKSGIKGFVTFTEESDGSVSVNGTISNLGSNTLHGFHIHQFGDVSDETNPCVSTGGHFNPYGKTHGSPMSDTRHVGDLGNIKAGSDGVAIINIKDSKIALKGQDSIIGRAVVVHDKKDDLGKGGNDDSLKTGNAGGRVGCGLVGIAKN